MTKTTCADAIRALSGKQLADWHGLPGPCTLEDLRAAGAELGTDERATTLGEAGADAVERGGILPGYDEHPRVWLRGGTVVRIEIAFPELDEAALVPALGEPAAKLDAYATSIPKRSPGSEWVWPARGIALVRPGGQPPSSRLVVFAPTTLAAYRAELRDDAAPREEH